jgi:hypothetical protein
MSRITAPGTGATVPPSAVTADGPVPARAGAKSPVPSPVRSPNTPRGKHGYVVVRGGLFYTGLPYPRAVTKDPREAAVYGTAREAELICRDVHGDAVYSLALARELVGEREGRG